MASYPSEIIPKPGYRIIDSEQLNRIENIFLVRRALKSSVEKDRFGHIESPERLSITDNPPLYLKFSLIQNFPFTYKKPEQALCDNIDVAYTAVISGNRVKTNIIFKLLRS
jgi:hypothetical protein